MSITNWVGVLPNLTRTRFEGEYGSAVGYRILRNERGHIWVLLQELLIRSVNRVEKEVTDLCNAGKTAEYTVKFSKFLKSEVEEQRKIFTGQPPAGDEEKFLGSMLWTISGLSFEEQRAGLEKAIQIAGKVLFATNLVIKQPSDLSQLESLAKGILEKYMVDSGAVIKDIRLPARYSSLEGIKLNCVAFVFLYLQDPDFIREWRGEEVSKALDHGRHVEVLKRWKYRPVAIPKEGDLVIYLSSRGTNDCFLFHPTITSLSIFVLELEHIGIYQRNGRVLSKNGGIYYPKIYEHNLNDIPSDYGNLIRFYRKIPSES